MCSLVHSIDMECTLYTCRHGVYTYQLVAQVALAVGTELASHLQDGTEGVFSLDLQAQRRVFTKIEKEQVLNIFLGFYIL